MLTRTLFRSFSRRCVNDRNPLDLKTQVPGAGSQISLSGQQQNQLISLNGGRYIANNYILDGVDNEDPSSIRRRSCRNELGGPGSDLVDMALAKKLIGYEHSSLRLRAEFFNVFNHPTLNNPVATMTSPQKVRSAVLELRVSDRLRCASSSDFVRLHPEGKYVESS